MLEENQNNISPYIELGATGLKRFGGFLYEEYQAELQGQRGIKIYREMADDHVVGAILFALKMLIKQASWRVDAAGDTPADLEAKEFLESCMEDMAMSWHDNISEILSMLIYGWSYHEIVYKQRLGESGDLIRQSKYNDGKIGWRKLPIRAQDSLWEWMFDDGNDGSLIGMKQQPPPDYRLREIPYSKALLFRTESHKESPEGRSIIRTAYKPWFFRKNIEVIEGIGIERDLAGLPVAHVPPELLSPNATNEQKAVLEAIKRMVTSLRRDEMEGVVFPAEELPNGNKTGYKLSLLSTGSKRNFDTNDVVDRYDQRIAMTVMADFLMLGSGKTGSWALSSDKTELFGLAVGAILDDIAGVFNNKAVPNLFKLNSFSGITDLPKLQHGDVESPNLKELGEYITALSGAGAPLFPDDQLENYLRQVASLPEKTETEEPQQTPVAQIQELEITKRQNEFTEVIIELREAIRKAVGEDE